jgi:hypothetical protein
LSDLVDTIRAKLRSGRTQHSFEKALSGSGWHDDDRERLVNRWTRRSESRAYPVVGTFPRLTPDALRHTGLPLDRIREVRYRVDLDGFESQQDVPGIVATAIGNEGWT